MRNSHIYLEHVTFKIESYIVASGWKKKEDKIKCIQRKWLFKEVEGRLSAAE